MENCPQSPSGLGPAQYQISTFHEQYSCPHFKSLILFFFLKSISSLPFFFFCPASVGLIRRLAGPPSYCRLLRTPLSYSELWAPPSSLALVLKGFLLLEWVNMFSDMQPDEESRLGSWTAVDTVRRLPPIFKFSCSRKWRRWKICIHSVSTSLIQNPSLKKTIPRICSCEVKTHK